MKINHRIIITITALATLLGACHAMAKKEEENNLEIQNISEETNILKDNLYDENIDYIATINDYLNNNKDLSDLEYKKAVYMLLNNTNIPMDTYNEELKTLLMLSVNPSCVDSFDEIFSNLITASKTRGLNPSFSYEIARLYLPLAAYEHELECDDPSHIANYNPDYDIYRCTNLEELYKEYNKRSK